MVTPRRSRPSSDGTGGSALTRGRTTSGSASGNDPWICDRSRGSREDLSPEWWSGWGPRVSRRARCRSGRGSPDSTGLRSRFARGREGSNDASDSRSSRARPPRGVSSESRFEGVTGVASTPSERGGRLVGASGARLDRALARDRLGGARRGPRSRRGPRAWPPGLRAARPTPPTPPQSRAGSESPAPARASFALRARRPGRRRAGARSARGTRSPRVSGFVARAVIIGCSRISTSGAGVAASSTIGGSRPGQGALAVGQEGIPSRATTSESSYCRRSLTLKRTGGRTH